MAALALAALLVVAPMSQPSPSHAQTGSSCTRWDRTGWPGSIATFLIHKRGSSVPARVVRYGFDDYVGMVLASGAAPASKPMAALRAMALVVATRAAWMVAHPQPGYRWHGRCYDIHSGTARRALRGADAGQYLVPGTYVHSRIRRAVADVRGLLLRRPDGSVRKPRWSGRSGPCGAGRTGNRLPANSAGRCARQGMGWWAIVDLYFPKGTVAR
jgi:hypothetical protein